MINLTREVRCSLLPGGQDALSRPVLNSWAGWPSASILAPFVCIRCTLTGEVDLNSGYLCNIKLIDDAIRQRVVTWACSQSPQTMTPELLTSFVYQQLSDEFSSQFIVREISLAVTPFLTFRIQSDDVNMMRLTHQFEFSASHRLHNDALSDQENQSLFGKCNNPLGHGHNYVVDITVAGQLDEQSNSLVNLVELQNVVNRLVINRFDHKYLNAEVKEFQSVNPSVENIAIVIWELLKGNLPAAELDQVRVYETPKTWADYRG